MTDRFDHDRTFKFQVAFVAVVALAGFGIVKKLVRSSRRDRNPQDYIPKDPPPLPPAIVSKPGSRPRTIKPRKR